MQGLRGERDLFLTIPFEPKITAVLGYLGTIVASCATLDGARVECCDSASQFTSCILFTRCYIGPAFVIDVSIRAVTPRHLGRLLSLITAGRQRYAFTCVCLSVC